MDEETPIFVLHASQLPVLSSEVMNSAAVEGIHFPEVEFAGLWSQVGSKKKNIQAGLSWHRLSTSSGREHVPAPFWDFELKYSSNQKSCQHQKLEIKKPFQKNNSKKRIHSQVKMNVWKHLILKCAYWFELKSRYSNNDLWSDSSFHIWLETLRYVFQAFPKCLCDTFCCGTAM